MSCGSDLIDFTVKGPCLLGLFSPSSGGKTHTALELVRNRKLIFDTRPTKAYFVYANWQKAFSDLALKDPDVTFTTSIDSLNDPEVKDCLIVLDDQDLTTKGSKSQKVLKNFALRDSHHKSCVVIYMSHTLFHPALRLIQLQTQYLCVFRFARDVSSVSYLARQLAAGRTAFIVDAYRKAIESREQGAYLFININCKDSRAKFWLRNTILPSLDMLVFVPRD